MVIPRRRFLAPEEDKPLTVVEVKQTEKTVPYSAFEHLNSSLLDKITKEARCEGQKNLMGAGIWTRL